MLTVTCSITRPLRSYYPSWNTRLRSSWSDLKQTWKSRCSLLKALKVRYRRIPIAQNLVVNPTSTYESLGPEVKVHLEHYAGLLNLSLANLLVTTDRRDFERWLGRRVSSSIGGAYVFLISKNCHAILINLARINCSIERAIELVVAEELVHMRDYLDGDRRRHAKHGHDRIAVRVANLTGASLDEIRSCLIPQAKRPIRYHYGCPACAMTIGRRRRGIWSCGRCSKKFDSRFVLQLVHEVGTIHASKLAVAEREGEAACSI
jgi:ribosomal protein L37AE/L43A